MVAVSATPDTVFDSDKAVRTVYLISQIDTSDFYIQEQDTWHKECSGNSSVGIMKRICFLKSKQPEVVAVRKI